MALRFGDCRLDLESRRLLRGGHDVHLSPKAFDLLALLVTERPRAHAKGVLLERVWRGVFVSEASLARVVSELRSALGDEAAHARVIRTVHGYGYAFAAEVAPDDGDLPRVEAPRVFVAWLTCRAREFALWPGTQIVGRDATADVRLESPRVSRRHARIVIGEGGLSVEDLGSKNGTFVNGVRISSPTGVEPGGDIRIGPFTLVFQWADAHGLTETQVHSSPA